jgi:hypothetical protein
MSIKKPSQDIVIELHEVLGSVLCVRLMFTDPDLCGIDLETSNVET